MGELSLSGTLRPVAGMLPMALAAREAGVKRLYVPAPSAAEATLAGGMEVYPVESVAALVAHLAGLESFGVPYLAPFTSAAGQERGSPDLIRLPLPWMKWRNGAARSANRRNQR